MDRFVRSLSFAFVTLLVASCAGTATASPSPAVSATTAASATPRPPKDQVKLPSVVSTELNLASLVAYAKDYFGEENIEVTDFVLGTSSTLRAAMIAKEYDFGLFAFVHDPIARLAGSPWKTVIATYDREIFSLLVRTPLKDSVRTVADLKGKNVGVTGAGSGSWAMANVYLKKAGLVPDKDVSLVPLGGDPSAIFTALQTGKVDAIAGWEPITSRVLETNAGFALVSIWDPKSHQEWTGSDHALALGLMTREDVIAAKPDLVKRMVNAHKKALDFIKASSPSTLADIILNNKKTAEQFSGMEKPLVVKLIERIKPGYGTGCLSKSGFDVEMNIAVTYQLVKQAITFQEFANTTYAGECP
jgi:NitT/TauT family transport system substrate-binding protein